MFPEVVGVILVLAVLLEVVWTVGGEGAGPIAKHASHLQWRVLLRLHRRVGSHRFLVFGGLGLFLFAMLLWVLILWLGWFLVFQREGAVIEETTRLAADTSAVIYFTGYTIFTLGIGDYAPNGAVWQVLTPIASLSGLFIVTLAITYLVSVIQAMTEKRRLALHISAMGTSGEAIVRNMCEAGDCSGIGSHLHSLTTDLAGMEQRLLSYPVLHYMHTGQRSQAVAPAVAALDEALSIIELGLAGAPRIDRATFRPVRQVITELVSTLASQFIDGAADAPPLPDLARLRRAGFATVEPARFRDRMAELEERRRLLRGWVEHDGWSWTDLEGPGEISPPTEGLPPGSS